MCWTAAIYCLHHVEVVRWVSVPHLGFGLRCHRVLKTCCELIGLKDVHCKVEGNTKNAKSIVRAFFDALSSQVCDWWRFLFDLTFVQSSSWANYLDQFWCHNWNQSKRKTICRINYWSRNECIISLTWKLEEFARSEKVREIELNSGNLFMVAISCVAKMQ